MAEKTTTDGYYTIIAPHLMRANHKYSLSVALHNTTEPCQLKVTIQGQDYNEHQNIEIENNEMKMVEFDIPTIEEGNYELRVNSVKGLKFETVANIRAEELKPLITIQTDKALYKPGDVLNYRVIFLDENLKPAKPHKEATILFKDTKQNRIREIKDFEVIKGVYTGKLQISEFAILGNWRLEVKNSTKHSESKDFEIAKYVLPKYEVKLELNSKVSIKDGSMPVLVKANYTYGKPVNGKVTLVVHEERYGFGRPFVIRGGLFGAPSAAAITETTDKLIRTANMSNGIAKFDVSTSDFGQHLQGHGTTQLNLKAIVEEEYTEVKLEGTATTTLYCQRYKMECVNRASASIYKPHTPQEVKVQVLHIDGTQVNGHNKPVKLSYNKNQNRHRGYNCFGYAFEEPSFLPKPIVFESHLDELGFAIFNVELPPLETDGYNMPFYAAALEYEDEKSELFSVQLRAYESPRLDLFHKPTKDFEITINREGKSVGNKIKLNETVQLRISSRKCFKNFILYVTGRGKIVYSSFVNVGDNKTQHDLALDVNFSMIPHAHIYAFYISEDGKFMHDRTSFQVDVELQNQLEITAPVQAKPSENIPFRIQTSADSFVGLLAVDQSVLLMRNNNDFRLEDLERRLNCFNAFAPWHCYHDSPGHSAGLTTLTNAHIESKHLQFMCQPQSTRLMGFGGEPKVFGAAVQTFGGVFGAASNIGMPSNAVPPPQPLPPPVVVRKNFVDTWIFDNIECAESNDFTWTKKIPDTITSWVLSGFAISPEKGLALTREPTKIRTFQPFFVSVRLPYAVKRGEVIKVPALVFNYLEQELNVELTLDNSLDEYDILDDTAEVLTESKYAQTLSVGANGTTCASFSLRPKVIGNIMLKLNAISAVAGDALHKNLRVEPEGVTQYANRAYFINLRNDNDTFKESFELNLPKDAVPDSQHIEFTIVDDLLAPMLKNLHSLIRLPTGCCEQTTSKLVPNYLVLRYLKNIGKLTAALEHKIKQNLEMGYQHLLRYQLPDGSFGSFFSMSGSSGSSWLTAYVIRSLHNAKEYITVLDENVIQRGLEYLASHQHEDGSFKNSQDFYFNAHNKAICLTANVLLTFAESGNDLARYDKTIQKAAEYIVKHVEESTDLLSKALALYALHKIKHEKSQELLESLRKLIKTDVQNERQWWSERVEDTPTRWWFSCYSNDVEITAYMLLTLLDKEPAESVLPIITWLVGKRNSYGGFSSSQDTVVGLQALVKFTEKTSYQGDTTMDINYVSKGAKNMEGTLKLNSATSDSLFLESIQLPAKTQSIDFMVQGKGTAMVQISYQYNVAEREKQPSFNVTTLIDKDTPAKKLKMDVCIEYVGEEKASSMALLEVAFPSGYVADVESFELIKAVPGVRLVETKNEDSLIVVYFDSLKKHEPKSVPVTAHKSFDVALQKPAPIVLYDYYDTSKRATHFYEVSVPLEDSSESK